MTRTPNGPRPRGARPRPLDEARVLAAARTVLETDGLAALSLARVAQRLGVTQPALYRHVAGIDELLRRLALVARTELLAELTDAALGRAGDDAIRAVATAWRRFATAHPHLYAVTDRSRLAGDPANEAAVAAIVHVLTRAVGGYGLADDAATELAWSLRSALHGFVTLEADGGFPSTIDIDTTFDRFVGLLLAGIGRWSTSA